MLERADRLKYIEPGREAFMSDEQIQDSVIRNLEIIGEAAKRVPPELRAALPKVDWPAIGAMRNISLTTTWTSISRSLEPRRTFPMEWLREFLRQGCIPRGFVATQFDTRGG